MEIQHLISLLECGRQNVCPITKKKERTEKNKWIKEAFYLTRQLNMCIQLLELHLSTPTNMSLTGRMREESD